MDSTLSLFLFSSGHGSNQGNSTLLLSGLTSDGEKAVVEITDPVFLVILAASDIKRVEALLRLPHINRRTSVETKGYRDTEGITQWMTCVSCASLGVKECIESFCLEKGVTIYSSGAAPMRNPAATCLNSGIGTHCSWYRLVGRPETVTRNKNCFPKHWTKQDKARFEFYVRCTSKDVQSIDHRDVATPKYSVALVNVTFKPHKDSESQERKRHISASANRHPLERVYENERSSFDASVDRIGGDFFALNHNFFKKCIVTCVSLVYSKCDTSANCTTFVLRGQEKEKVSGDLEWCESEKDILASVFHKIVSVDPQVIVVEIDTDLVCLKERYCHHKMDKQFDSLLSKLSDCIPKVMDRETVRCNYLIASNQQLQLGMKNRISTEKMNQLRCSLKSKSSTLSHVVAFGTIVLNRTNMIIPDDIDLVGVLTRVRSKVNDIIHEVKITGASFTHYGGQLNSTRPSEVYNLIIGKGLLNTGTVLPVYPSCLTSSTRLEGGLVLDPKPCLTFRPVVTLDFVSLYPSLIEAMNLCPSTLCANPSSDVYETSVRGLHCMKPSCRKGILPATLSKWKAIRQQIKAEISTHYDSQTRDKLLSRERALKACLVTAVGQNMTTAKCKTPFHRPEIAHIITSVGRKLLTVAKDTIETEVSHTLLTDTPSILGGDTDSLFVLLNMAGSEKALTEGKLTFAEYIDQIKIVVEHAQSVISQRVSQFLSAIVTENVPHNVLQMKVENISLASLHYPQKKRYVHTTTPLNDSACSLICKGVLSKQGCTLPFVADTEILILRAVLCGWYLCVMMTGVTRVLSPQELLLGGVSKVYVPTAGWKQPFAVEAQGEEGLTIITVTHSGTRRWSRKFAGSICIEQQYSGSQEIVGRMKTSIEIVASQLSVLLSDKCDLTRLFQFHPYHGDRVGSDKYNHIGAHIARSRQVSGLCPVFPFEKVPSIRIIKHQKVRFLWQASLVSCEHQDPLLVVREGLQINKSWYRNKIIDLFTGEGSLLSIMATNTHSSSHLTQVEDVRKKLFAIEEDSRVCYSTDRPGEPDGTHVVTVGLSSHFCPPKDMALIGSERDQEGFRHYYINKKDCYRPATLHFARHLLRTRSEAPFATGCHRELHREGNDLRPGTDTS